MATAIKVSFDKKELPELESGAMCHTLSKKGYLSDKGGHWHPHLMSFSAAGGTYTMGCRAGGVTGRDSRTKRIGLRCI